LEQTPFVIILSNKSYQEILSLNWFYHANEATEAGQNQATANGCRRIEVRD